MNMNYFHPVMAARKAFNDAIASGRALPLTRTTWLALVALLLLLAVSAGGALVYGVLFLVHETSTPPDLLAFEAPMVLAVVAGILIICRPTIFFCTLGLLVVTKGPTSPANS
jgi:hypothetical protein